MNSREENNEDWKEIRSRVDSIANAVFLVASGALSLSITVILENKSKDYITPAVVEHVKLAWYALLASIVLFLFLKALLVIEAFLLQTCSNYSKETSNFLNTIGWFLGILGFVLFSSGLFEMVRAAVIAISA